MVDFEKFKELARRKDWASLHAMLDDARDNAQTADEVRSEVHWRIAALGKQKRYQEALDLLRDKAHVYASQCLVQHKLASLLVPLGRESEALDELSKAPFDAEITSFYGVALDAKFFYLYLLAKAGDTSAKNRLSEIPDDYQHISSDGTFLTKTDIVAKLKGH